MVYSDTLKIEGLEKSFSNILNSYNLTYDKYLDYLNSISKNNIDVNRDFILLSDVTNVSNDILDTIQSNSKDDCKNLCVANASCKGATFLSSAKNCILNKGDDLNIVLSQDNYAVITKLKVMIIALENLNFMLIETNKEIQSEIAKLSPYKNELDDTKQKKSVELDEIDKKLKKNKEDLLNKKRYYEF